MSKCELSLKVLRIANFSQLVHLLLEELSHGEVPDPQVITHLLKISKCELSVTVLQIANFSQITHIHFGELSISEFSDP